jgi:predicted oxidoreductase
MNRPVPRIPSPDGAAFSRIAWGMGSLPPSTTVGDVSRLLATCLDCGITTVDNAENYGGYTRERLLGDALRSSQGLRDRLELVTKCGCVGTSPDYPEYRMYHYDTRGAHIERAVELSLRNFGTDRLDALLLHRPDPLMDADDVAEAFVRLRGSGKVLHFGVSNFVPSQVRLLQSRLPFPLVTDEVQLSVLAVDALSDGTLDLCQEFRMPPMAWGPLGRGRLFSEEDGRDDRVDRVRAELRRVGLELGGAPMDQVALAWLLQLPARPIPILGSGVPEEIRSAVGALDLSIDRQSWYRILNASLGESIP